MDPSLRRKPHISQMRSRFLRDELTGQYLSDTPGIATADHSDPALTRANDVSLQHFVLKFRSFRAVQVRAQGYDWS